MNIMMKVYLNVLNILTNEEEGQGMAEYGLILALVAVVAIAAFTALGGNISTMLDSLSGEIVP